MHNYPLKWGLMLFEEALQKNLIQIKTVKNNLLVTLPNKQTMLIDPLQVPSLRRSLKLIYGQFYLEFGSDVNALNAYLNNQ